MNCGHNFNLDITLKPRHNRDDLKIKEYPSTCPSLPQGWLNGEGEDDIKWITLWSLFCSL